VDACLQLRCLATDFYSSLLFLGTDHIEISFPSIVASIRVYRAIAWQRVDQIHYNVITGICVYQQVGYEGRVGET
jgi:hypothetical protein